MLWALADPLPEGRLELAYPYFEREEPMVLDEGGTYVETDVEFEHNLTHEWNHGLGEIVTALLDQGLVLDDAGRARQRPVGPLPGLHRGAARRRVPAQGPPVAAAAQLHDQRDQAATARPCLEAEVGLAQPGDGVGRAVEGHVVQLRAAEEEQHQLRRAAR